MATYPPNSGSPLTNDSTPGAGDGDEIDADHINSIVEELGNNPGGGTTVESRFDNLDSTVASKASASHTHSVSDITASGISSTKFLRGDNTWAIPEGAVGGGSGDGSSQLLVIAASDSSSLIQGRADLVCSGSGSDASQINGAIAAANNQIPGGTSSVKYGGIELCEGTFKLESPILIPSRGFVIKGQGQNTILTPYSPGSFSDGGRGTGKALIKLANTPAAEAANHIIIRDMHLWCNDWSGSAQISGIYLSQTTATSAGTQITQFGNPSSNNAADTFNFVDNIFVSMCWRGIHIETTTGTRGARIHNCHVGLVHLDGFYMYASDMCLYNSQADSGLATGAVGFRIRSSNSIISGCKAYYFDDSSDHGYYFQGSRVNITHCEAQDNTNGFTATAGGGELNMSSCRADNQISGGDTGFNLTGVGGGAISNISAHCRSGGQWATGINLPADGQDFLLTGVVGPTSSGDGTITTQVKKNGTAVTSSGGLPNGMVGSIVRVGGTPLEV